MTGEREREGVVEATLPRGLYRVRCDDGTKVTATLSKYARQVSVGLRPGERVLLEVASFDPTRARITAKQK